LAIDPECWIAEQLCASRVPACKGGKEDFLAVQPEGIDTHLIGFRVRLVDADGVRAQPVLEKVREASVTNVGVEHRWREIVQEREADAILSQLGERGCDIRPGFHIQISVDQSFPLFIAHLQAKRLARENECIVNDAEKIPVLLCSGAQPGVLELPDAPDIGQFCSAAGKELFGHREDGTWVKNGKAIEGDRLDDRLRIGCGSSRGEYPGSRDGAGGNFEESTTVDRHGVLSSWG